jgi:hypothetical protein
MAALQQVRRRDRRIDAAVADLTTAIAAARAARDGALTEAVNAGGLDTRARRTILAAMHATYEAMSWIPALQAGEAIPAESARAVLDSRVFPVPRGLLAEADRRNVEVSLADAGHRAAQQARRRGTPLRAAQRGVAPSAGIGGR